MILFYTSNVGFHSCVSSSNVVGCYVHESVQGGGGGDGGVGEDGVGEQQPLPDGP